MEINLGNIGIRHEAFSAGIGEVKQAAADETKVSRPTSNVTIGEGLSDLPSAEPVADVPASALTRDDDLGKLVGAAFNLPPPPMPAFGN